MSLPTTLPLRVAVALLLTVACSTGALAQDPRIGRAKAQACAVCHGAAGIAVMPDAPNLAGQPAPYLTRQMKAFRNGTRANEVMAVIAKALTDDDIAHLAAWFSSIHVEAVLPN